MPFEDAKTIFSVLRGIQTQDYVLPAIQREFIWDPDTQITRLFDSLMRGYPIGTFLSWAVKPPLIGEFKFHGFMRNYHQRDAPYCPMLDLPNDQSVTAILDGQQRLTALNIGLRGSHAKRRKYGWKHNPNAYPKRTLYLNLLGDAPENELGMAYDFRFFEVPPGPQLAMDGDSAPALWYPVRSIFDASNPIDATKFLLRAGIGDEHSTAADRLGRLYELVHNEKVLSFFREDDQDVDRVLDIFIRVNSAGNPLSQSDLLLSIASAQFVERDARNAVHSLVDSMNRVGNGFTFDKDLVLKAGLALVGVPDFSFKVRNFNHENTALLDKHWDELEATLLLTAGLLSDFGYSQTTLSANSVAIPIAYYLRHRGLNETYRTAGTYDADRRVVRTWVNRTLIKPGIWGSGLDTLLRDLRNAIRDHGDGGFPVRQIEDAMRPRGKSTTFTPEEVVDLLALRGYKQKGCFPLLAMLFPHVDTRNLFHIDHVFPQKMFGMNVLAKAGLSAREADALRGLQDRLPNLQLLEGPVNIEKQATPPKTWAENKYGSGYFDYLARNDLPLLSDSIMDFADYYLERKRRLARRLAEVLGVDQDACEALVHPEEDEAQAEQIVDA